MLDSLWCGVVSPTPTSQAGVHLQPEGTPCRGDKGPA